MQRKPIITPVLRQLRTNSAKPNTGRVEASNGYILIRVGTDHPMADVRGYAYEHRLVMAEKLGRNLRPDEIVHHKNEIKSDNDPSNLELCEGIAEHFERHRKSDSNLRRVGEGNPLAECQCGCGQTFPKYDDLRRPRAYISGHNPQPSTTARPILELLAQGPTSRQEIIAKLGKSEHAVAVALCKLKAKGKIQQIRHGIWAAPTKQENGNG